MAGRGAGAIDVALSGIEPSGADVHAGAARADIRLPAQCGLTRVLEPDAERAPGFNRSQKAPD
jgi:hypothetical protein